MTAGLPVTDRVPFARPIMFALAAALVVVIAGCGGGGGDEQAASVTPPVTNPPPTVTPNQAPTISGSPTAQVLVGVAYSFHPTSADADGNTLTFSITGKPSWATFSTSTGTLSGTPGAGDVGTTSNIVITVSDGTTQTSLAAFSVTVVAVATGSATLSWTPPTQNTDGSALTNLAGYKIYWGTSQNSLSNSVTVNNPGLATYMVTSLTPATWYFAVTAVNAGGTESARSNVGSKQVL
jgi:putative Ig domain-containing protein